MCQADKHAFFYFHLEDERSYNGTSKTWNVYPSHVYGPFNDPGQAQEDMTRRDPNNHAARFLLLQGQICEVTRSPLEKPESEKRAPEEKNWTRSGDGRWTCNDCKATIQAVQVAHPVHDGPFPLSGSGECRYTEAGYCPNCDKKPSSQGQPVSG